ncbi:hypothetical protein R3P38DRAFT_3361874 [Favolaschia claudopus]|uniref:Uncharacterized protein n=1 Tax=Favolaschia claudopus TaxID=2862362 RepID=A0AAW0ARX1_9AGAR
MPTVLTIAQPQYLAPEINARFLIVTPWMFLGHNQPLILAEFGDLSQKLKNHARGWMGVTLAAKVVSGKVVNTSWKSSLSTAKYAKLGSSSFDIRTGNGAKNNAPIHVAESFRWRQKPRSRKSVQKTSGLWGKQLENETVNNYVSKNGAGICVLWAARFQGGAGDLSLRICISFGVQERRIPPTRVRIQIDQRSQREDRVADSCQHLVILGDTTSGLW